MPSLSLEPRRYGRRLGLQLPLTNYHAMKVAVFGKPGGGKSTLARQIATAANLPLVQLDLVQYRAGGARASDDDFLKQHAEILAQPTWVVDGFGTPKAFEAMLRAAD